MNTSDRFESITITRNKNNGKFIITPVYKENCSFKESDIKLLATIFQLLGEDLDTGFLAISAIKWD